jgi:hypothetical protein
MKLYNLLNYYAEDVSDKYNKLYRKYLKSSKSLLGRLDYLEDFSVLPGKVKRFSTANLQFYLFCNTTLREKNNFTFNNDDEFKDLDSLNNYLNRYLESSSSLSLFISREFLDYIQDEEGSKTKQLKEANKIDLQKVTILTFQLYKITQYISSMLYKYFSNEKIKQEMISQTDNLIEKIADLFERDGIAERLFPKLDETYFKNFPPTKPSFGLNNVVLTIRDQVKLQNKDLKSVKFYFYYDIATNTYSIINYEGDTKLILGSSKIFNFITELNAGYTPIELELQKNENKEILKQELKNENSILYTLFNIPNIKDKFNKVIFSNPKSFNIPKDKMQNIKIEDIGKLGDLSFE